MKAFSFQIISLNYPPLYHYYIYMIKSYVRNEKVIMSCYRYTMYSTIFVKRIIINFT